VIITEHATIVVEGVEYHNAKLEYHETNVRGKEEVPIRYYYITVPLNALPVGVVGKETPTNVEEDVV